MCHIAISDFLSIISRASCSCLLGFTYCLPQSFLVCLTFDKNLKRRIWTKVSFHVVWENFVVSFEWRDTWQNFCHFHITQHIHGMQKEKKLSGFCIYVESFICVHHNFCFDCLWSTCAQISNILVFSCCIAMNETSTDNIAHREMNSPHCSGLMEVWYHILFNHNWPAVSSNFHDLQLS